VKKLLLLGLVLSQAGATDCGTVLRDPGFDLWCGDQLCSWKVVRGDVARVGTWHEGDSGVELLGSDSAISQLASVNTFDGNCIEFSMIANVDSNVDAFLHVDVFGDGTIERSERIPSASWQPVKFHLLVETPFNGIRFELAKQGNGTVVLAQIGAQISDQCAGLPEITVASRPDGASCDAGDQCASGMCAASPFRQPLGGTGNVCVGCSGASCGAGMICGAGEPLTPTLAIPLACVGEGTRELAEQCASDADCASGICNERQICSACSTNSQCGNALCGVAWVVEIEDHPLQHVGPEVCRPGEGASAPGAACGSNADCASGSCSGSERKECWDGRACNSPADCPVITGLAPDTCANVGIQGGTCD
jgi:hypothetical protein